MNVYKLEAAIGLNSTEYQKGLKAAGDSMAAMGDKIKAGAAAVGKATAAGLAAGSAAVTALAKSAVSAYADYEQLTGGVEKLFGESSDLLMMYAKDAANTAGMSINAYMETATSFAAALTTSVQAAGGSMDEAVEYADTAMRDMSDNANTFGTDIASIQTAYQGFAKQNYTMLDNLKLGYGGTKAEMERLIEDANKLRHEQGINNDLTIESYADIITAIHEVQTQMNITGTTAREASKTISGSIGAVKAAWTNLTIEMAKDDGDIGGAFQAFGENVGAVVDNMLPRVEQAIGGIGDLISKAAPEVISGVKSLLPKVLPSLVKSAGQLVGAVSQGVLQATPELLDMGKNALKSIAEGFTADDINFEDSAIGIILGSITDNIPEYLGYAETILANLGNALINTDHAKLGEKFSKVITSGLNSITDLLADLDMNKVGQNIADFVKAVDWKVIAKSIVDLLGAALGSIGDIAAGFFENMDGETFLSSLSLIAAPKLLSSMLTTFKTNSACTTEFTSIKSFLSAEIGSSGEGAAMSWSSAFMVGIKAFGLGYAIGTYLRDNITIGDKTLGEWVDQGTEKTLDKVKDSKILNSKFGSLTVIGRTVQEYNKALAENDYSGRYVTARLPDGTYGEIIGRNKDGTLNEIGRKRGVTVDWEGSWKNAEHNAVGNYITKPTLTWAAENEPEYIIPESKMNEVYPRNGNNTYNITVNVDGYSIKNDMEFTELLSDKLAQLGIIQQRAVGGKSWA